MEYYIMSIDPDKIIDQDLALFHFLNREDFSVNDIYNHINGNINKNNIVYILYYMGQFNKIDSNYVFNSWLNYVKSKIDIIANGCNYKFNNDYEKYIISLGLAIRTFYFKILDNNKKYFQNVFTKDFTDSIINLNLSELSDEIIFSLYYIISSMILFFRNSTDDNFSTMIKLIKMRMDIQESFEKISNTQYNIIHGEN